MRWRGMSPNYKAECLLGLCNPLPLLPGFTAAEEGFRAIAIDVQLRPPVVEDYVLLIEIKLQLP